jgi:pheromone shutdown protein TraB
MAKRIWKRVGLTEKQNELYRKANQDWDTIAMHYPLRHQQTGMNIHIVGVHHNSPASIYRVENVIQELKPCGVLVELHPKSLQYVLAKSSFLSQPRFHERVQQVIQGSSLQNHKVSDVDKNALRMYGISSEVVDSEQILYGAEMGAAINEANKIGSEIVYIDESPKDLQYMIHHDNKSNIAQDAQTRFQLYYHKYRSSSSLLGEMIYQLLCLWVFRGSPVNRAIQDDFAGIGEHLTHLQLWSRFHPSTWYWFVGLRDAVMVERIRQFVTNRREEHPNTNLDPKTIVVVVGKTHYFGIKELWARFIEKYPQR